MSDYLIFGNVDSRNYNIEVFFKEIDTTPKRVYERVDIVGRNGALLIDQGRYEDVPVTYDCVALDDDDRKAFASAIASQTGYRRLEDSFNTDEYYKAVFDEAIEPNITPERDKSTFSLLFTRYPQRFLTSGETLVTVANNGTITNPTRYESQPTIQVNGYGTLKFNGYEVTIENALMGEYELMGAFNIGKGKSIALPTSGYNNGDTIIFNLTSSYGDYIDVKLPSGCAVTTVSVTSGTAAIFYYSNRSHFGMDMRFDDQVSVTAGTASAISKTAAILVTYTSGGSTYTANAIISSILTYKANGTVEYTANISDTQTLNIGSANFQGASIVVDSTVSILGNPTVIDCEIGEAYKIENSQFISLNKYIDLGSDLPVLASGTNTFTKSNTMTSVKVKPNWWEL